jgi:hypothetical protein
METNGLSRREFVVAVPSIVAGVSAIASGQTGGGGQAVPWSGGHRAASFEDASKCNG